MGNLKIRYLHHEVAGDNFSDKAMTGIKPVTSAFSVYCYYFEVYAEMNEIINNYMNGFIAYVHVLSTDFFTIVDVLLASIVLSLKIFM